MNTQIAAIVARRAGLVLMGICIGNQTWAEDYLVAPPLRKHPEEFRKLVIESAPQDYQKTMTLLKEHDSSEDYVPKKMLFWGESGVGKTTAFEVLVQESGKPGKLINGGQLGRQTQNSVAENLRNECANLKPGSMIGIDNFGRIVHASQNNGDDVAVQVWEIIDALIQAGHTVVAIMNEMGKIDDSLKTRFSGNTIKFSNLQDCEKVERVMHYYLGGRHKCGTHYLEGLAGLCREFSTREIRELIIHAKGVARIRGSKDVITQDLDQAMEKMKQSRSDLANEKKEGWLEWGRRWGRDYVVTKEVGAGAIGLGTTVGGYLKWAVSKLSLSKTVNSDASSIASVGTRLFPILSPKISLDPAKTAEFVEKLKKIAETARALRGLR